MNFCLYGQKTSNFKSGIGYGYNFNSNGDIVSGILELDFQYNLSSNFLATITYGNSNSYEFNNYSNITNIFDLKMENTIPINNNFKLKIQYGFSHFKSNVTDVIFSMYGIVNDNLVLLDNLTEYYESKSFGNIIRLGFNYSFEKSEINIMYGVRYYYNKTIFNGAVINFRYCIF